MPVAARTPVVEDTYRKAPLIRGGYTVGSARRMGSYHDKNEDSVKIFPGDKPKFCAVADGVGGGSHGEVASAELLEYLKAPPIWVLFRAARFVEWLTQADRVVADAVARESDKPGATTGVAAWFLWGGNVRLMNVGDCRGYLLRSAEAAELEQVTIDQTYSNLGLKPPAGGSGDDPARMIGVGSIGVPNTYRLTMPVGSTLLLCTDGVHKFVREQAMHVAIQDASFQRKKPQEICEALVQLAIDNGGHDDASAVLAVRRPWFTKREHLWLYALYVVLAVAAVLSLST